MTDDTTGDAGTGGEADSPTQEPVVVPGGRDVRGTLDRATSDEIADACVVACPPHPQHRGHRGDDRLVAVSETVRAAGIDCLRFDYGDWDEGYGERADVRAAVDWARERYDRVGLFGFSFGATLSLLVAGEDRDVAVVVALAPTARIAPDLDAVAAVPSVTVPLRVVYGSRDDVADWEPVVAAVEDARRAGADAATRELAADHFFVGQTDQVAAAAGEPLVSVLAE